MNGSGIEGGLLPAKVFFSGSGIDLERTISINGTESLIEDSPFKRDNFNIVVETAPDASCSQSYYNEDKAPGSSCCYRWYLHTNADLRWLKAHEELGYTNQLYISLEIDGINSPTKTETLLFPPIEKVHLAGKMRYGAYMVYGKYQWELNPIGMSEFPYRLRFENNIICIQRDSKVHTIKLIIFRVVSWKNHPGIDPKRSADYVVHDYKCSVSCGCNYSISVKGCSKSACSQGSATTGFCCGVNIVLDRNNSTAESSGCVAGWELENRQVKGGITEQQTGINKNTGNRSAIASPKLEPGLLYTIPCTRLGTHRPYQIIDRLTLFDQSGCKIVEMPIEAWCCCSNELITVPRGAEQ